MKKFSFAVVILTLISLLTGCAGTAVVYYSDCTCPTGSHEIASPDNTPTDTIVIPEGELRTGLAIDCTIDATDATADTDGTAGFDIILAGVLLDEKGVIVDCTIDAISHSIHYNTSGEITSDISEKVLTKNEQGDSYGMVTYGGAISEWYQQAEAFAQYAIGKTADALKNGAITEEGYAADADLAASATINLGGFLQAVLDACNNAQYLGAEAGDELVLSSICTLSSSTTGTGELDVDTTALTRRGDIITSCYIDALQSKVILDESGHATDFHTATKNALGESYGMKLYAGSAYEWNEQAAAFAKYVTGKTADEVAGITVSEGKATDVDLAASVTISIGNFLALIAKAMK